MIFVVFCVCPCSLFPLCVSCFFKIKSCSTMFFFCVYHWSPSCLLPCLPLIVSDTVQMPWQKIETVWHEKCCLSVIHAVLDMDQTLPASGASITINMHTDAELDMGHCNRLGSTGV